MQGIPISANLVYERLRNLFQIGDDVPCPRSGRGDGSYSLGKSLHLEVWVEFALNSGPCIQNLPRIAHENGGLRDEITDKNRGTPIADMSETDMQNNFAKTLCFALLSDIETEGP